MPDKLKPGMTVVVNDLIGTPLYKVVRVRGHEVELHHTQPARPEMPPRIADVLLLRQPSDAQLRMHQ